MQQSHSRGLQAGASQWACPEERVISQWWEEEAEARLLDTEWSFLILLAVLQVLLVSEVQVITISLVCVCDCRRQSLLESQVTWWAASKMTWMESFIWLVCTADSLTKVSGEPWRRAHTLVLALLCLLSARNSTLDWWKASEVRRYIQSLMFICGGCSFSWLACGLCLLSGVRLKSCKTQTSFAPVLSLSAGQASQHSHLSLHHSARPVVNSAERSTAARAIPLRQ